MLNMIFLVLVAISCVVIWYLLIRPKLYAIAILYPHLNDEDAFWAALFLRIKGWRIEAFAFAGIAFLELLDVIDMLVGANVVAFLPMEWQRTAQIALLLLTVVRAFMTKRSAEEKVEEKKSENEG